MLRSPKRRLSCVIASVSLALAGLGVSACNDDKGNDTATDGHTHDHEDGSHTHDVTDPPPDSADPPQDGAAGGFVWTLPYKFRRPPVPADNPMSSEKVELGRHLFYDTRLSDNRSFSCASCHKQSLAFTDGRATGLGSTGESHTRGSMSLTNVGYSMTLTWANPTLTDLETQANTPVFGTDPVELGMASPEELESRLRAVPRYVTLFSAAFPAEPQPVMLRSTVKAVTPNLTPACSVRPRDHKTWAGSSVTLYTPVFGSG